jgi:hypothetical protein
MLAGGGGGGGRVVVVVEMLADGVGVGLAVGQGVLTLSIWGE